MALARRRRRASLRARRSRSSRRSRARGAMFLQEPRARVTKPPAVSSRPGLRELIALGRVTCDSFGGAALADRAAVQAPGRRIRRPGRWSLLRARRAGARRPPSSSRGSSSGARASSSARRSRARSSRCRGATSPACCGRSRRAARSAAAASWPASTASSTRCRRPSRSCARSGGTRRRPAPPLVRVSAADPLNFRGILTPDERVSPVTREKVQVASRPAPALHGAGAAYLSRLRRPTGLRSNFPLLWMKSSHSEALSQAEMCL